MCEVTKKMYDEINLRMQKLNPLHDKNGDLDWEIVWGPCVHTFEVAKYQDNMMFVTRQKSDPSNYIVAIRGTNAIAKLDWIMEDFDVWKKVTWELPKDKKVQGTPKISAATDNGIQTLLDKNKMSPCQGLPGEGMGIIEFLTSISNQKCNIMFTGHSLAGALAPTLALYFKTISRDKR